MSSCRQWRGSLGGCRSGGRAALAGATVPAAGSRRDVAAGVRPCLQPSSPLPAAACKKQEAGGCSWVGEPSRAHCMFRRQCVSLTASLCSRTVPGLGHQPHQPQASSLAFPVLLQPLAVEAVTAQLTPGHHVPGHGGSGTGTFGDCRAEGSKTLAAGLWGNMSAYTGLAPALRRQEQFAELGEPRAAPARSRSAGRAGRHQAGPTAPGQRRRSDLGVQLAEAALLRAWGCSQVPACGGST